MLRKEHLWRMYLCSFGNTGNNLTCPFCNSDLGRKRDVEHLAQIRKRAEANDPGAINELANYYLHREGGSQQDHANAMELCARAAELGSSQAHYNLGIEYRQRGYKFQYKTAAMAGHELARCNLGNMEAKSGNIERALKHWMIAASAGDFGAMHS